MGHIKASSSECGHQHLLWEYGVSGLLLNAIWSLYEHNLVCIFGVNSKLFKEDARLCQGYVLIPPLFMVFMNRILRCNQDWRGVQSGGAGDYIPVICRWCSFGLIGSSRPLRCWDENQYLQVSGHGLSQGLSILGSLLVMLKDSVKLTNLQSLYQYVVVKLELGLWMKL